MEEAGRLEVLAVARPTPRVRRVTFAAPEGFEHWPDQQLKLYFPRGGALRLPESDADTMRWYQAYLAIPLDRRPWMRSFTVRAATPDTLEIDFVLHDTGGPAVRWARQAAAGQVIGRYGPSVAYRRALPEAAEYLFAGDETAVPAVTSLLAALPSTARAAVVLSVHSEQEEQPLPSAATVETHWVRGGLAERIAELPLPEVAWLAGEAGEVRTLRRHLTGRGMAKDHIEFTGYWRRALTQDDPPTGEDLAEARERAAG